MSVNLSGNQGIDQTGVESSQIRETQVLNEYNPSIERYKDVMATFSPGINYDNYTSTQIRSARPISFKTNKSSESGKSEDGIIKKTTKWISSLLGVDETDNDELSDLLTYNEVLPGAGFGRTVKEYQLMQKAFSE